MTVGPWPATSSQAAGAPCFTPPLPLGVGCTVMPARLDVLARVRHLVDVVEVSPDQLAHEAPDASGRVRTRLAPRLVDPVLDELGDLPVLVHGLELSIGSADRWNDAALDVLDEFDERRTYRWNSEHIGFLSVGTGAARRHAGIPLPLPFTAEAVDLVAARADAVQRRTGRPFLLENACSYLPALPRDAGWDEPRFLTELCERSSCGLLLDLFNLWVNCVNFELDPWQQVAAVPLDRVVEVHLAGGDEQLGLRLDSHSAVVPEPVWELADHVVAEAPNLAAVIFEVGQESFERVGIEAYLDQMSRTRHLWLRHRPPGVPDHAASSVAADNSSLAPVLEPVR